MTNNIATGSFDTYDIALAAYLICAGYELSGMDRSNRSKVLFHIKRGEGIDAAVKAFWDSRTSVDAQSYFNHIKRLKNQIHSS